MRSETRQKAEISAIFIPRIGANYRSIGNLAVVKCGRKHVKKPRFLQFFISRISANYRSIGSLAVVKCGRKHVKKPRCLQFL